VYEQNAITGRESTRPVSDNYYDPGARQVAQHPDQVSFAHRVERRRGLIQNQYPGTGEQGAGDRYSLLLAD
jgi:hypothetical protein